MEVNKRTHIVHSIILLDPPLHTPPIIYLLYHHFLHTLPLNPQLLRERLDRDRLYYWRYRCSRGGYDDLLCWCWLDGDR